MTPSNEELEFRIRELEKLLAEEQESTKPLINLYNAGKVIGRIFIIIGGIVIGIVTIWNSLWNTLLGHGR